MLFTDLVKSELPDDLSETVYQLLDLKMNSPEIKEIPRIDQLNRYLDAGIGNVKEQIEKLPDTPVQDWDELNELFFSVLER